MKIDSSKHQPNKQEQNAVTLIEIVGVLTVLIIFLAFVIPGYKELKSKKNSPVPVEQPDLVESPTNITVTVDGHVYVLKHSFTCPCRTNHVTIDDYAHP